jgi:hypothetical protein
MLNAWHFFTGIAFSRLKMEVCPLENLSSAFLYWRVKNTPLPLLARGIAGIAGNGESLEA